MSDSELYPCRRSFGQQGLHQLVPGAWCGGLPQGCIDIGVWNVIGGDRVDEVAVEVVRFTNALGSACSEAVLGCRRKELPHHFDGVTPVRSRRDGLPKGSEVHVAVWVLQVSPHADVAGELRLPSR